MEKAMKMDLAQLLMFGCKLFSVQKGYLREIIGHLLFEHKDSPIAGLEKETNEKEPSPCKPASGILSRLYFKFERPSP